MGAPDRDEEDRALTLRDVAAALGTAAGATAAAFVIVLFLGFALLGDAPSVLIGWPR